MDGEDVVVGHHMQRQGCVCVCVCVCLCVCVYMSVRQCECERELCVCVCERIECDNRYIYIYIWRDMVAGGHESERTGLDRCSSGSGADMGRQVWSLQGQMWVYS
jgi:hypothetical protein